MRDEGSIEVVFFPKGTWSKTINNIRIGPDWDIFYGVPHERITDWDAGLFGRVQFQNSALLNFAFFRNDYTYLFSDFDPTNTGGIPLPAGTAYRYKSTRLGFTSNQRNPFFLCSANPFREILQWVHLQCTGNYQLPVAAGRYPFCGCKL